MRLINGQLFDYEEFRREEEDEDDDDAGGGGSGGGNNGERNIDRKNGI